MIIEKHRMASKPLTITFVDFTKAYDCIDRAVLGKVLHEFGLDNNTREVYLQTLSDTSSKVKFRGTLSESFGINTGVRQGDGISPLMFNCALEKVIREWSKQAPAGVGMGRDLRINALAFADDIAILSESIEDARLQLEILSSEAAKIGLKISLEKTQFMTSEKNPPKFLLNDSAVGLVENFKYLGESISIRNKEDFSLESRTKKLSAHLVRNRHIYNKRSISRAAKIRHYLAVGRPEATYAAETMHLHGNVKRLERMEIVERRILRKILGPNRNTDGEYRLKPKKELYQDITPIVLAIKKQRMAFFGHVVRMSQNRLAKKIETYWSNRKTAPRWLAETKKDLNFNGITAENIQDRALFRAKTENMKCLEKVRKPTGRCWSDARKLAFGRTMKNYWAEKKRKPTRKD